MIDKLLSLFKEPQTKKTQHTLDLACAVLLVEIMKADYELLEEEKSSLTALLKNLFSITDAESQALFEQAEQTSAQSNDLFQYTDVINKHWSLEEKFKLVQGLWQVAYSDKKLDKYEEYMIRKISDLLYLPHSQFIRAKLSVQPVI